MTEVVLTLVEVLTTIEDAPWGYALYLDPERPWSETTHCTVLDPNNVNDPESDEAPEFATMNGLVYALLITEIQGIVDNARQQKSSVTAVELVRAFNFYYNYDAFIKLT